MGGRQLDAALYTALNGRVAQRGLAGPDKTVVLSASSCQAEVMAKFGLEQRRETAMFLASSKLRKESKDAAVSSATRTLQSVGLSAAQSHPSSLSRVAAQRARPTAAQATLPEAKSDGRFAEASTEVEAGVEARRVGDEGILEAQVRAPLGAEWAAARAACLKRWLRPQVVSHTWALSAKTEAGLFAVASKQVKAPGVALPLSLAGASPRSLSPLAHAFLVHGVDVVPSWPAGHTVDPVNRPVCPICQEDFRPWAGDAVLLSCSHVFHGACLGAFVAHARKALAPGSVFERVCPMCRRTGYAERRTDEPALTWVCAAVLRIQALLRGAAVRRKRWLLPRGGGGSTVSAEAAAEDRREYYVSRMAAAAQRLKRILSAVDDEALAVLDDSERIVAASRASAAESTKALAGAQRQAAQALRRSPAPAEAAAAAGAVAAGAAAARPSVAAGRSLSGHVSSVPVPAAGAASPRGRHLGPCTVCGRSVFLAAGHLAAVPAASPVVLDGGHCRHAACDASLMTYKALLRSLKLAGEGAS